MASTDQLTGKLIGFQHQLAQAERDSDPAPGGADRACRRQLEGLIDMVKSKRNYPENLPIKVAE